MFSKKKEIVKKEIVNSNEINTNREQYINPEIQNEEINQEDNQLIIYNDGNKNTSYRYYRKEIYINDDNNNQTNATNLKKKIYKRVKTDLFKPHTQKAHLSYYIYREGNSLNNKKYTEELLKYNNRYNIKNPIKERSKKLKRNNSNIIPNFNNRYLNENPKNLNSSNRIGNYTVNDYYKNNNYIDMNKTNEEEMNYINKTNYMFYPRNDLDSNPNVEFIENENPMYIQVNRNKGGNIHLNFKKRQNDFLNKRENIFKDNEKYKQSSERNGRISYIYDYSQEDNKNSYYVESPTFNRYMSIYPLKKKKKRKTKAEMLTIFNKNNKSSISKSDKLKKKIEDSWRNFEKIREIEKKIKDYFNMNGLNIENRELYDQSATMIQSAFRAYFSRVKLYKKLNLFINIRQAIDLLKKIILPRKANYWENFLKGILNYLSFITKTIHTNNNNDKIFINEIAFKKKIPNSYRKKTPIRKAKNQNDSLLPQSCVSLNYFSQKKEYIKIINLNGDKNLEEKWNKILSENDELKKKYDNLKNEYEKILNNGDINNKIIKDTQESVELKIGDVVNLPLNNNTQDQKNKDLLKITKLKYLVKNLLLKKEQYLIKYFMKFYYKSMYLKKIHDKIETSQNNMITYSNINNTNDINIINNEYSFSEIKDDTLKLKKLKNLVVNKDKNINNLINNKFIIYYFKGLIEKIKNGDIQNNNENNIKDENGNNDKIEDKVENKEQVEDKSKN